MKILLVDNTADCVDALADVLIEEGHEVTVAYNAQSAIDACKVEQFDVTLLELLMPDKNGVECLIEMRKMRPDTKVVVVAGVDTSRLAQTAISEGAISVFAKPLDLNTFLPVLEDLAS